MRVCVPLSGTDAGRSGLSVWVKNVVPRLAEELRRDGGHLRVVGTPADLAAYEGVLDNVERHALPRTLDRPGVSALWHLFASAGWGGGRGIDVWMFPAANRRVPLFPRAPTVGVVHDLAEMNVQGKYHSLRGPYVKAVVASALRTLHRVVAISDATRRDVIEVGVRPSRVSVIPNGIDADLFGCVGPEPRAEMRSELDVDGPYLLYPARLEHPGKNHLRLLEAFAKSAAAETHALLMTGSDWGAQGLIEECIARLKIDGRARVLGRVDDRWMPPLFAECDAVLMPGLHEGFGLPALEGLALGRPVAASNTGALPEVVGELGAYFCPTSVAEITAAIDRVVLDEDLRRRVVTEGPILARACSWDSTAAALLEVCKQAERAA